MTAFPLIFHYSDYRLFLKDYLKALKDEDKKYSQRYIIMKIGESSAGWVSDVIAGRKNINETQMFKLCQILDLDPRSEIFFELLVKFSQAGTHEERTRIYDKLRTFQECPSEILDVDRFEYFNKWYHAAIRELLLARASVKMKPKTPLNCLSSSIWSPKKSAVTIQLRLHMSVKRKHSIHFTIGIIYRRILILPWNPWNDLTIMFVMSQPSMQFLPTSNSLKSEKTLSRFAKKS